MKNHSMRSRRLGLLVGVPCGAYDDRRKTWNQELMLGLFVTNKGTPYRNLVTDLTQSDHERTSYTNEWRRDKQWFHLPVPSNSVIVHYQISETSTGRTETQQSVVCWALCTWMLRFRSTLAYMRHTRGMTLKQVELACNRTLDRVWNHKLQEIVGSQYDVIYNIPIYRPNLKTAC